MKKEFDLLVKEYGLNLSKLCSSLCNNSVDAQDLYQSTWEKAIKKYKKYDRTKPFEKWLFTICVNTYRDSLKRFDRKNILKFNSSEEQERFLSSIADFSSDKDEYIALHNAVKRLNFQHREVIVLYYFKDYSIEELSEILKIPVGTVKSRLHTAREKLRKELNYND